MSQDYKIVDLIELGHYVENKNGQFVKQLESNLGIVYKLEDSTFALMPVVGKEGLLFYSHLALEAMIESGIYPVKGDGSFFEKEKELIDSLEKNIPVVISRLSKKMEFDIKLTIDKNRLDEMSKALLKYRSRYKMDEELSFLLGIYFGELLRREINGMWILDKQYTLNI